MQVHCGCEVCGGEAGNGWVTGARRRARTTLNIAAAAGNVVCQGGPFLFLLYCVLRAKQVLLSGGRYRYVLQVTPTIAQ